MAALQKLRDHGKLIAIVVGLALALFIVGDMIRSGQAVWGKKKFYIAEVDGQPITYQEYEKALDDAMEYYKTMSGARSLDEQTMISLRTQVWDQLILRKILDIVQEKTGLVVSPEELTDMVLGPNPDPLVRQIFRNPQTGQYDPNFARQVLMNLDKDPKLQRFWLYIEKNLKVQRLAEKYAYLVAKAIMATNFDAEQNYYERSTLYDLQIAPYLYRNVPDSVVNVTEADLKKYYEKYKGQFYQSEETRRILYVVFPIVPTAQDSAAKLQQIEKLKPDFEKTADPVDFVNINSDRQYVDKYYTKDELPKPLDSLFFVVDTGYVYGPYVNAGAYNLARLLDRQKRPDTVSFRHILISPQDKRIKTLDRARQVADSLYNVIKQGDVSFDALVREYSADQGSVQNGGRYEGVTEGQMVPEINDFIFSGKKGDIKVIETQYGVHIVEILDQKAFEPKVKVAFLTIEILPSQQTYDDVYREAALFRSSCKNPEDFERIAQEKGWIPRVASNLTKGSYVIPGLPSPRNIIHWAFNAKVNEISNVFDLDNMYVVAKLVEVRPAGYLPFDEVKDYIRQQVLNEKKGDYVLKLIKDKNIPVNDVQAFAQAAGTSVINATNVSFNAFAISGVGYEPVIFGALDLLKQNQAQGPFKGKNAVYVLDATSITIPPKPTPEQLYPVEQSLTQGYRTRVVAEMFDKIKRDNKVEDYRTRFF